MTKLMDNDSSCSMSAVFNNNMAAKKSIVSKYVVATNLTIMCYMAGPHYKIIVTNNRVVTRFRRAVNRAVLSDLVVVTYV